MSDLFFESLIFALVNLLIVVSMIITNPLTNEHNDFWREKIRERFAPNEPSSSNQDFLSLKDYLVKSPQKYYSHEAFNMYLHFLNDVFRRDPVLLKSIFIEKQNDINVSNKVLNEVNAIEQNDELLSENDNEVINLVQNTLTYNYLRVLEAPFYTLTYIISKVARIDRKAKTEGLDLYNIVNELQKTSFSPFLDVYDGVLRNSIAHGKFSINSLSGLIQFVFSDSKGNSVGYEAKKLVYTHDKLLDVTNAFFLAYKVFVLINNTTTISSLKLSSSIYIDEILASASGPSWRVTNVYEILRDNKKHLSIYAKSSFLSMDQDRFQAINTSIIASKFFTDCDIIYLDIKSFWTSINVFHINLSKLRKAVSTEWKVIEPDIIELYFWIPKYRFVSFFRKLQMLFLATVQQIDLFYLKRKYSVDMPEVNFLINQFTDYKTHMIINARCVVVMSDKKNLQKYVQSNYSALVNLAKKDALKRTNIFSKKRVLPIKFVRVYIYAKEVRKRQIDFRPISSGLFCVIEWDIAGKINPIEIFDSCIFETYGVYRLTWDEEQLL